MKHADDDIAYSAHTLGRRYGLDRSEAERLLARFSRSKEEMDMLIAARGRTATHRRREIRTPAANAAFGIN